MTTVETDYVGPFHYEDADGDGSSATTAIQFFAHEEGRVRRAGSDLIYESFLKDHLGNVRVMFADMNGDGVVSPDPVNGEVLQVDHYYPFGLRMAGLSLVPGVKNSYTFTGKEVQDELSLGWIDFGARMYAPDAGRWKGVDFLAESYFEHSPFAYVLNNPLNLVDPDGMQNTDPPGGGSGGKDGKDETPVYHLPPVEITAEAGAGYPAMSATDYWYLFYGRHQYPNTNYTYSYQYKEPPGTLHPKTVQAMVQDPAMQGVLAVSEGMLTFTLYAITFNIGAGSGAVRTGVRSAPVVAEKVVEAATKGEVVLESVGAGAKGGSNLWKVGSYSELKGLEVGLDAHHVAQKTLMKNFVPGYNLKTAPSILVPEVGHTIRGVNGIVSRNTAGITNARQLLARDIFELRRVYGPQGIPNSSLQQLIQMNKTMYPRAFIK